LYQRSPRRKIREKEGEREALKIKESNEPSTHTKKLQNGREVKMERGREGRERDEEERERIRVNA
jgi:hypothetical protein